MHQPEACTMSILSEFLERGEKLYSEVRELQGRFDDWLMNGDLSGESLELEAKLMCDIMKTAADLAANHRMMAEALREHRVLRHMKILKVGHKQVTGDLPRPEDEVRENLSLGD